MGMSASQARLLSITSRINDVEFKSQCIANQKIRLASESEELAQAYTKALNQQRFTLKDYSTGETSLMTLKSLTDAFSKYKLVTSDGKPVLTQTQYDKIVFKCSSGDHGGWAARNYEYYDNDKKLADEDSEKYYVEAWCEKCLNSQSGGNENGERIRNDAAAGYAIFMMTGCDYGFDGLTKNYGSPQVSSDRWVCYEKNSNGLVTRAKYDQYYNEFVNLVSTSAVKDEKGIIKSNTMTFKSTVAVSDENAKDPNWLYNAIESGEFMLVDKDGNELSPATMNNVDTEYDKEAATKAEAEYNAASLKLNNKEKILDNELKKLDTEHNALQTEHDSIKDLIGKNIEKTFNLFS